VQDGEQHGPFDRKLETALGQELGQDARQAEVVPEPFKDQGRSEAEGAGWGEASLLVGGDNGGLLGEAATGSDQGIDLAGGLEEIATAEGSEDVLANAAGDALVVDELEVFMGAGLFDADKHGWLRSEDTTNMEQPWRNTS
jgi:hypothetical protein